MWYRIDEREPGDECEELLLYDAEEGMFWLGFFREGRWKLIDADFNDLYRSKNFITHWRELEPPEETNV